MPRNRKFYTAYSYKTLEKCNFMPIYALIQAKNCIFANEQTVVTTMTEEIRKIIDSAKARGLYEQMLDAAKEYVKVPKEERRKRCYLITGKQHDILEGVIELEGLKPHNVSDTL